MNALNSARFRGKLQSLTPNVQVLCRVVSSHTSRYYLNVSYNRAPSGMLASLSPTTAGCCPPQPMNGVAATQHRGRSMNAAVTWFSLSPAAISSACLKILSSAMRCQPGPIRSPHKGQLCWAGPPVMRWSASGAAALGHWPILVSWEMNESYTQNRLFLNVG